MRNGGSFDHDGSLRQQLEHGLAHLFCRFDSGNFRRIGWSQSGRTAHQQHPRSPAQCRLCKRSEEHTSELQSLAYLVCRLLLEKKKGTEESACRPEDRPASSIVKLATLV